MSWWQRGTRSGEAGKSASTHPRQAQRRFDGAVVDRLTASWMATNVAIDFELRNDLNKLRARSRDMAKNNEYAAKFLRLVRNNVVGPEGFQLQCKAVDPDGTPDTAANKAIEQGFDVWSRRGNCEITGTYSFVDLCRLLITAVARDGEFLLRKIRGSKAGPFGYMLQVLDIDRLDTLYNVPGTQSSNAVVMGVEMDPYRRPVAYHLWNAPQYPGDMTRFRERVPATEIIHRFIALEPEQTRGVPWMHAGMRRANDLNGYREAAVVASRAGASKMGMYISPDGAPPFADGKDVDGNFITEARPGEFDVAPAGYDFKSYDPTYPHQQFGDFNKATLRGVSSAWGVSYPSLGNDLEGVNFSSIRTGVLEDRDEWMVDQNWFIGAFLSTDVFPEFLECGLQMSAFRLPNGKPLPLLKIDKFSAHLWQGRRWQWVDPMKDVEAAVVAINNRLASPQQIAAQSGRDIEDVIDDIAAFEALCKAKGIASQIVTPPAPKAPTDDLPNAGADGGSGQ